MNQSGQTGVAGLIHHLRAWAREELATQRELQAALEAQSAAVRERGPGALELATERVEGGHQRAFSNDQRRAKLFARFAECWGVAPATLTLGSILLRAGESDGSLAELRQELRTTVAKVQATAREVGAELRLHRRITTEVLGTLLGQEQDGTILGSGALLSTEA